MKLFSRSCIRSSSSSRVTVKAAPAPTKFSGDFGDDVGRKPLLGGTALFPEFGELPDTGGTGRVDAAAVAQLLEDAKQ